MPSPFALSLISPKEGVQLDKAEHKNIKIINFLNIIIYKVSILAALKKLFCILN